MRLRDKQRLKAKLFYKLNKVEFTFNVSQISDFVFTNTERSFAFFRP